MNLCKNSLFFQLCCRYGGLRLDRYEHRDGVNILTLIHRFIVGLIKIGMIIFLVDVYLISMIELIVGWDLMSFKDGTIITENGWTSLFFSGDMAFHELYGFGVVLISFFGSAGLAFFGTVYGGAIIYDIASTLKMDFIVKIK